VFRERQRRDKPRANGFALKWYKFLLQIARTMKGDRPTQQEIERDCFEKFRSVYPLPAGPVFFGDKPDVVIGGNELGIEITNFYVQDGSDPSSEQVQCWRREKSVSTAQKVYEQATGKNFRL
jgi:hypothetical protein